MKTEVLSPQLVPKMDVNPRNLTKAAPASAKAIYTCPMHPEVQQDHPGECPKCGMTLELKTPTAGTDESESAELRYMTRRLWIGAALASGYEIARSAPGSA